MKSFASVVLCLILALFSATELVKADSDDHWLRREHQETTSGSVGHAGEKHGEAYHLVVLGDPHIPGANLKSKEDVLRSINSWDDVRMVIAVGDLCEDRGTDREYAEVKKFFGKLRKPFYPIAGNHDYFYEDVPSSKPTRAKAAESREAKLAQFRDTFSLDSLYYSKRAAGYLLVFLSCDSSTYLAGMSSRQMDWLAAELRKNREMPTIVFFHAPLRGTFVNDRKGIDVEDFVAQPSREIAGILDRNPQVFLWVSGHTHFTPNVSNFNSKVNFYEDRILNVHNADMKHETIWTNSLFLYEDSVRVRTYDHERHSWLKEFDRTVPRPR